MAKLSEDSKKQIIADYHTNQYSQRDLAKKHGVSIGTINKLTKTLNPKNEHVHNAQVTILRAKAILPPEEMNAIEHSAKDQVYNEMLATNASQLLLIKSMETLSNGNYKRPVKMKSGDFDTIEQVDHDLTPTDLKALSEGIDKASITLGVNPRHAQSQVQFNNQNNNKQSSDKVEIIIQRDD